MMFGKRKKGTNSLLRKVLRPKKYNPNMAFSDDLLFASFHRQVKVLVSNLDLLHPCFENQRSLLKTWLTTYETNFYSPLANSTKNFVEKTLISRDDLDVNDETETLNQLPIPVFNDLIKKSIVRDVHTLITDIRRFRERLAGTGRSVPILNEVESYLKTVLWGFNDDTLTSSEGSKASDYLYSSESENSPDNPPSNEGDNFPPGGNNPIQ